MVSIRMERWSTPRPETANCSVPGIGSTRRATYRSSFTDQPVAEVTAGHILSLAAGQRRTVYAEGHFQGRLVDRKPGQHHGALRRGNRVADLDAFQADQGTDITGVDLVDFRAAEVLEDVNGDHLGRRDAYSVCISTTIWPLRTVPDCTRPMAIRPT